MPAPENVDQLVKRFEDNREFLDPFFETLGWDVFNKQGYAETYNDVMSFHKQSPRTPQEQVMVKREIESTDKRIDRLVYGLCRLTKDELKIVEGEG